MTTQTHITRHLIPEWLAKNLQIVEGYIDFLSASGYIQTINAFITAENHVAVGFLKDIGEKIFQSAIEHGFGLTHTKLICGRCHRDFDTTKAWWYTEDPNKHYEWWHEDFQSRWRHNCADTDQVLEFCGIGLYVYDPKTHPKGCTRCGAIYGKYVNLENADEKQSRRICTEHMVVDIRGDGLGQTLSDCVAAMKEKDYE